MGTERGRLEKFAFIALLALVCLTPLLSLFHRNDLRHWVFNRSIFISPDEFSYLLTAKNIAAGHGIALKAPLDTFYPPGFPAVLAAWAALFGFGLVSMHVCVVTLACVSVFLSFVLARAMLARGRSLGYFSARKAPLLSPRSTDLLALLIAALYATSFYSLKNDLSILSESTFTCCITLWMYLALRWQHWWNRPLQVAALAVLSAAAMSIRSAALICFMTTAAVPWLDTIGLWWYQRKMSHQTRQGLLAFVPRKDVDETFFDIGWLRPLLATAIVVVVGMLYLGGIAILSPAKNIFSPQAKNGYLQQLLWGLTNGHRIPLVDIHLIFLNFVALIAPHLNDFSHLFAPVALYSPEYGIYNVIGKLVLLLAMLGLLTRLFFGPLTQTRFIEIFAALYIGLYAIWPFDFVRFWLPLLPVMMVYVGEAMGHLGAFRSRAYPLYAKSPSGEPLPFASVRLSALPWAALALMLVLNVETMVTYYPAYQDRLNYVSDCLRGARPALAKNDPGHRGVVVSMEPFTFDYYTGLKQIPTAAGPYPKNTARLVLRLLRRKGKPRRPVFIAGYFGWEQGEMRKLIAYLKGRRVTSRKVYDRDMVTFWRVQLMKTPRKARPPRSGKAARPPRSSSSAVPLTPRHASSPR